jgi:hypothetical protein
MKKNISNYEALLISLASDGDSTAFHSLVIHHLSACLLKMTDEGMTHSDASAKLCATGATLFKSFIGAQPTSFDSWLTANGERADSSETEFLSSNKMAADQLRFSNELRVHLQRYASSLQLKNREKKGRVGFSSNKTVITISVSLLLLFALISAVLFFSHSAIKLQVINSANEQTLFLFGAKQKAIAVAPDIKKDTVDSSKVDTIPKKNVKVDTLPKVKERPAQSKKTSSANGTDNQTLRNGSSSQSGHYRSTEASTVPAFGKVEQSSPSSTQANPNESSGNLNSSQQPSSAVDSNSSRFR